MDKLLSPLQGRKKSPQRLNKNSKLFKAVIEAIKDKKGENIVSLDLRKIDEAVADFFIISQAQSHIQVKAIADNITHEVKKITGELPYHVHTGEQWTLIDYVNIVIHIFREEYRQFYDLEGLWEDAEKTEHSIIESEAKQKKSK